MARARRKDQQKEHERKSRRPAPAAELAARVEAALKNGGRMLRKAAAVSVVAAGCFASVLSGAASVGVMMGAAASGREASANVHAAQEERISAVRQAGQGAWGSQNLQEAMEMAESDKEACAALLGVGMEQMDERNVRRAAAMLIKEGDEFFGPEHPRILLLRKLEKDAAEAAAMHRDADERAMAHADEQKAASMALRM